MKKLFLAFFALFLLFGCVQEQHLLYDVQIPPATTCEDMGLLSQPPFDGQNYYTLNSGYKGTVPFVCYDVIT